MFFVERRKDISINAVGDVINREMVEDALLCHLRYPMARRNYGEIGVTVNPFLKLPLPPSRILLYGGITAWMGTLSTPYLPPVTVVTIGTVSRKRPHIVESKYSGFTSR